MFRQEIQICRATNAAVSTKETAHLKQSSNVSVFMWISPLANVDSQWIEYARFVPFFGLSVIYLFKEVRTRHSDLALLHTIKRSLDD